MTLDYQALLYDPIYESLAVDATLVSTTGVTASLSVIDGTTGIAITDRAGIETIRPIAYVRTRELSSSGIAAADLAESELTFNDVTWRIKAARSKPAPTGESDGETMLILLSQG